MQHLRVSAATVAASTERILWTRKADARNGRNRIMTLVELQAVLGRRIEIAENPDMDIAQRKEETEISQTIASLAKQMINNADIVLRAEKLMGEGKLVNSNIEKMIR
jgi:hypothetical protein